MFNLLVSDEMKLARERTNMSKKIIVSKNDLEHSDNEHVGGNYSE